jgi:hypothetical protein
MGEGINSSMVAQEQNNPSTITSMRLKAITDVVDLYKFLYPTYRCRNV